MKPYILNKDIQKRKSNQHYFSMTQNSENYTFSIKPSTKNSMKSN